MPAPSGLSVQLLAHPTEVTPGRRADLTAYWRDVVNCAGADGAVGQGRRGRAHPADRTAPLGWVGALQFTRHGRRDEVLRATDLRADVADSGRILGG